MANRFFPRDPGIYHHPSWHSVFGLIFFFAMVALLVLLAVWVVNGMRHGPNPHTAGVLEQQHEDAALREARMRYARGELTRKQFLEITTDLGGVPASEPTPPTPPA